MSDVAEAERVVADELARPEAQSETRTAMTRDLFYNPGAATEVAVAWLRKVVQLTV